MFGNRLVNLNWVSRYSVQFSYSVVSDSFWPHGLQQAKPPCPSPTPRVTQIHVHWVGDAIQPSHLLSSPSPAAFNLPSITVFSSESVLRIRWPKYWSFGFSISLPMNIQDWFPLGWTDWISFCPRDSQESSPTPHFKSIDSFVLSFLYSPTFTSTHD